MCRHNTDLSLELGAFLCLDVKWLNKGEEQEQEQQQFF